MARVPRVRGTAWVFQAAAALMTIVLLPTLFVAAAAEPKPPDLSSGASAQRQPDVPSRASAENQSDPSSHASAEKQPEASPAAGGASDSTARIRMWSSHGQNLMESSIWVPHEPDRVWPVVLDYDGLARFMPGVDSSRVVSQTGDSVRVHQVASARFLFRKTYRFDLVFNREDSSTVRFHAVAGDFREFTGTWEVQPVSRHRIPGSTIRYSAVFQLSLPVPRSLWMPLIRRRAQRMLPALAAEIERRDPAPTGKDE